MTDLTGWTPHEGGSIPNDLTGDVAIMALLRGGDAGPRESGPSPAAALTWSHAPALAVDYKPDPMDAITGRAPPMPAGDLIAWRRADDPSPYTSYPHVRADLGMRS